MKLILSYCFTLSIVCLLISCKNEPTASEPLVFEHPTISKAFSDNADGQSHNFFFKGSFPKVVKGSESAKDSINRFVCNYIANITGVTKPIVSPDSSLELIRTAFRGAYLTDTTLHEWYFEIKDYIWYNTTKVVTVRLDGNINKGGAHPDMLAAIGNFNPATGRQIQLDELVKDKAGLKALLEAKYREVKREAFKQGYDFSPEIPFKLPYNFGFTNDGIMFHYNNYDVAPYVIGDADIVVPYAELEKYMDFKKYL